MQSALMISKYKISIATTKSTEPEDLTEDKQTFLNKFILVFLCEDKVLIPKGNLKMWYLLIPLIYRI